MPYKNINYQKEYYLKNKDKFKEYYKNRIDKIGKEEHTKQNTQRVIKWRLKNPIKFKEQHKQHAKNYKMKYPNKIKALNKTQLIKIPKNYLCDKCKKNKATEKHHINYNQPTKLKFLCRKCHKDITLNRK